MPTVAGAEQWLDKRRKAAQSEASRYRERDPERAARARRRADAMAEVREAMQARRWPVRSVGGPPRWGLHMGRAEYGRRYAEWRRTRRGESVARACLALDGVRPSERGDSYSLRVLEAVDPRTAAGQYQATEGWLALAEVTRSRRYANSYGYGPSTARTVYLCGQDHGGPYAHPVHRDCRTIAEALQWVWQGYWRQVRERQGDVAIVEAAGPKYPRRMPITHRITERGIEHGGHGLMRFPSKGERVIVARRAEDVVREGHGD